MTELPQTAQRVLKAIGKGHKTATEVKDYLGIRASTISHSLQILRPLGLVHREQSEESLRVFNLSLTEKGEAAYKTISEGE